MTRNEVLQPIYRTKQQQKKAWFQLKHKIKLYSISCIISSRFRFFPFLLVLYFLWVCGTLCHFHWCSHNNRKYISSVVSAISFLVCLVVSLVFQWNFWQYTIAAYAHICMSVCILFRLISRYRTVNFLFFSRNSYFFLFNQIFSYILCDPDE